MRRCSTCKVEKEETEFYWNVVKEKPYYSCKSCHNKRCRNWEKNNRKRANEIARKHREQYPEAIRQTNAKHRKTVRRQEYVRQYRETHRENYALYQHKRRVIQQSLDKGFSIKEWELLKAIYGDRCVYCGRKPKKLTIDHIVPLIKGGLHAASNIVPACQPCNSSKHDREAPSFQPVLKGVV